jgi:hypothetical protein
MDSGILIGLFGSKKSKRSPMVARKAAWYSVCATGHFGYPQPEDGYGLNTYGPTTYCKRCGIHQAQLHDFRFRSEPKAQRTQFLQLNWVMDELFVRPEVRAELEKARITGIGFRPAVHHRSGQILKSIQQLVVLTTISPALVMDGVQTVTCKLNNEEGPTPAGMISSLACPPDYPYCGRVKYMGAPPFRFRRSAFDQAPDIVKSHEWFGGGGAAFRDIFASERVIDLIKAREWRGLGWEPVPLQE